jgi:hypothetical protein
MATQFTGLLDYRETTTCRCVIGKHVERVLAGVESRFARLDSAIVLKGLADPVLESTTPPVLIKPLE